MLILDIREARFTKGRSINLALSHRGRKALAALDLESLILQTAISMKGRLLHNRDGKTKSILYDSLYNQVGRCKRILYLNISNIFDCIVYLFSWKESPEPSITLRFNTLYKITKFIVI